jgi:hypothetical protein
MTRGHALRPRLSGFVWFGLMVGAWAVFFGLLLFSEQTLGDLWSSVRDLPLLVEGIVWLLLFPLVLGLAVWNGEWETWLRLLLVVCFALGWSIAFYPRRERSQLSSRPSDSA